MSPEAIPASGRPVYLLQKVFGLLNLQMGVLTWFMVIDRKPAVGTMLYGPSSLIQGFLASIENGQAVPRVIVFRCCSFNGLRGLQRRSHKYVVVQRPVFFRYEFPRINT